MVDLGVGTYLSERPSKRYPIYTRGNAGEVWPEVTYPLTISLSRGAGDEPFTKSVLASGVLNEADIEEGPTCFGGVFGGYMYLNVSINRVMAIRLPGVSIEQADVTFLGSEGLAPPHRPHRKDKNLLATLRAIRTGWQMLNTTAVPVLEADQKIVADWKARVPELLAGTDEQLIAAAKELMDPTMEMFTNHLEITGKAGGAMQLLSKACEEQLGDASLALTLLGGLGDVDSAAASFAMWTLGRMVAGDPVLAALFGAGIPGLDERLRVDPAAERFNAAFAEFLDRFGSRGPNEWESACDTWGTAPELALTLIDRMCSADPEHDPALRAESLAAERVAAVEQARSQLNRFRRWSFDKTLAAATLFSRAREREKATIVDLIHVARLLARELGARTAAQVEGGTIEDLWFVTADELDAYVADPNSFRDTIAARRAAREELARREPPFIFEGELPSPLTWPLRSDAVAPDSLAVGDSISGIGGCAGVAVGRARVITDPSEPGDLGPGDVLIAPLTDPAWTPLFVPVEAIVVDVGGQMSHAVIVSRELGRPCVVAATDATKRIPDGATVSVDGKAGTVTILELPPAPDA
jgi:phosphohistidine swiveling domain-containing protein